MRIIDETGPPKPPMFEPAPVVESRNRTIGALALVAVAALAAAGGAIAMITGPAAAGPTESPGSAPASEAEPDVADADT